MLRSHSRSRGRCGLHRSLMLQGLWAPTSLRCLAVPQRARRCPRVRMPAPRAAREQLRRLLQVGTVSKKAQQLATHIRSSP